MAQGMAETRAAIPQSGVVMLVLTRKMGSEVMIETADGIIRLKLLRMTGSMTVRVGFDCSDDVGIYRGEEYEAKKQTKGRYANARSDKD